MNGQSGFQREVATDDMRNPKAIEGKYGIAMLSEKDVCTIFGFSVRKLREDRVTGRGLPWCRIGRSVRYPLSGIEAYIEKNMNVNC
jgi:hypothetical protein